MAFVNLDVRISKGTLIFGLKAWVILGLSVGLFVVIFFVLLSICLISRKKFQSQSQKSTEKAHLTQVPTDCKDITEMKDNQILANNFDPHDKLLNKESDAFSSHNHFCTEKANIGTEKNNHSSSIFEVESNGFVYPSGEDRGLKLLPYHSLSSYPVTVSSPLPEQTDLSQLGWGHWFTLRELELATNRFSKENIIGEGGYGIVYHGHLINGSPVAIKKILNNLGQAEKEFRVEVEAIGHVRHKNLVCLLGYCIEGTNRLLVYEYVNNGNLDQWLHGSRHQYGYLTWEARMNILIGTAKALAYLHEGIDPRVVHRDIKSSNILIDDRFNAKISDFGLAKMLDSGISHMKTRVMGTFGYVAPEYANSGLLSEKSDVYSFGVLLLEAITGKDPVDYGRPMQEVNLVDWLKMMVGSRSSEELVDPNIETRPSTSALKRALLTVLWCVDLDAHKRPGMGQVVRMLESEEYPVPREDRRPRRMQTGIHKVESQREISSLDSGSVGA